MQLSKVIWNVLRNTFEKYHILCPVASTLPFLSFWRFQWEAKYFTPWIHPSIWITTLVSSSFIKCTNGITINIITAVKYWEPGQPSSWSFTAIAENIIAIASTNQPMKHIFREIILRVLLYSYLFLLITFRE